MKLYFFAAGTMTDDDGAFPTGRKEFCRAANVVDRESMNAALKGRNWERCSLRI
jgi:hypothetical protein